jgi:glutamate--cysteine ligase
MDAAGIALLGMGCDPVRPAVRQLTASRYLTMERFFTALGEPAAQAGRTMMCSTAAEQVSVDAGLPGVGLQSAATRWHRAHAVGPVLVAAFANSPLREGRPTGYRSTRQWNWSRVDPSRTRPPADGQGPVDAMAALALDARVMTIRDADGTCQPAADGLTLRDWMACVPGTRPTTQDLEYHLSTLFPPVRFRGWMEVRYLDALPDPFWQVPVSVVAALMDDDRAADTALEACEGLAGQWLGAAREGTADPVLRRAAQTCLLAAAIALRDGGQPRPAAAVEGYVERWTSRGRTPADDVLDQVTAGVPTHTHLIASE